MVEINMDKVYIPDISLNDIILGDLFRLKELRELQSTTCPEICTELAWLMTRYMQKEDDKHDPPELRAGKRLMYILKNKKAIINDKDLLAGTTTTKTIGAAVYPHLSGTTIIWPELDTVHIRDKNRYGKLTTEEKDRLNLYIFPYWMDKTILDVARKKYNYSLSQQVAERMALFFCSKPQTLSHTIPYYDLVVKYGLEYFREQAEIEEARIANRDPGSEEIYFYQAVRLVIDGVLAYAQNLSNEADRLFKIESDPKRRKELETMRDICAKVPGKASGTFREALNAIWICQIAIHQENYHAAMSLGRLDQILFELYCKDMWEGKMTIPQAVELVGCFWLKMNDLWPMMPEIAEAVVAGSATNQAVTLGGVDLEGKDAVNDLTYIMLKATELLKLRDPNVICRYYPGVNKLEYLKRLCEVNIKTGATPCFYNDKPVIEALEKMLPVINPSISKDVIKEHARDYAIVGCVEPTSAGRTFGHTGSVLLNLTSVLEMTLFKGKHPRLTKLNPIEDDSIPKPPEPIDTFPKFMKYFEANLLWMINHIVDLNEKFGRVHQELYPTPLLSVLMEGCMDEGKDVIQGGALYNSSGVTVAGLGEVVDSLTAVEEFVFNENNPNSMSLEEEENSSRHSMEGAIKYNWGYPEKITVNGDKRDKLYEKLRYYRKQRQRIRRWEEKFGNDSETNRAKTTADRIIAFLHNEFQKRPNYRGGRYTVGYWTMTFHAAFGSFTGALPSGRLKGEPLSNGISPVSGQPRDVSACQNFVARLDKKNIVNGHALNLKFTPSENFERDVTSLANSIDTYMQLGGMQIQFNVIDRAILEDAMRNPSKYPELLVRVSGYTAYFSDLNRTMQQEIIDRAEYNLGTGKEVI